MSLQDKERPAPGAAGDARGVGTLTELPRGGGGRGEPPGCVLVVPPGEPGRGLEAMGSGTAVSPRWLLWGRRGRPAGSSLTPRQGRVGGPVFPTRWVPMQRGVDAHAPSEQPV